MNWGIFLSGVFVGATGLATSLVAMREWHRRAEVRALRRCGLVARLERRTATRRAVPLRSRRVA